MKKKTLRRQLEEVEQHIEDLKLLAEISAADNAREKHYMQGIINNKKSVIQSMYDVIEYNLDKLSQLDSADKRTIDQIVSDFRIQIKNIQEPN